MTEKCFPLDENTLYADFAVSILSLAPIWMFLALIASVSVFVGLPNLLFLLRTSWYAPNKADKKIILGGSIDGQTKRA